MGLRIDNSGRSVIYTFDHSSETVLAIMTYDIPNERGYFSRSFDISVLAIKFDLRFFKFKFDFFHFYFFNMDFSFGIQVTGLTFLTDIQNIHMERTVSQIFLFRP